MFRIKQTWMPSSSRSREDYVAIPGSPIERQGIPMIDLVPPTPYSQLSIQLQVMFPPPERRLAAFARWKAELFESQTRHDRFRAARMLVVDRRFACTGCSSSWCPVCGDCLCNREDGGPFEHPDCPLHAVDSPHAEGLVE